MEYQLLLSSKTSSYLKKLKDFKLKDKLLYRLYDEIALNPSVYGKMNNLFASSVMESKIAYNSNTYLILYVIEENNIYIIGIIDNREVFYKELSKFIFKK